MYVVKNIRIHDISKTCKSKYFTPLSPLFPRNLRDMDIFSKSDPFCVTFIRPFGSDKWHELHRTEIIMNNLHPEWTAKA